MALTSAEIPAQRRPVELVRALDAVDLAYSDPGRSRRIALGVVEGTEAPEALAVAHRALGMAYTSLDRFAEAEQHLRTAIATAEAGALPVRAAEARGTIAYLLALTGRADEALAATDAAAPALTGIPGARLAMLRALVLTEIGHFDAAADGFGTALGQLAAAGGDDLLEADIRTNRSIAYIRVRDWRAAEDDLSRAGTLYDAAGHVGRTAMVFHNRGLAAAVRGDLPAALAAYDDAADRYRTAGRTSGTLPIDRAEALLSVLLVEEAREVAREAVERFRHERNAVDLVQARLLLARSALLDGDAAVAADQAARARRASRRHRLPGWAALAAYLALRARWETGPRDAALMTAGRRAATLLDEIGWAVEALDARILVARTALTLGRSARARAELEAIIGASTADGPAELQARMWHAQALLRVAEGDPAGAEEALTEGVTVLDRFRASLGATELRVHAAGHAGEIARTGVRLTLDRGDAAGVLRWTERWRAGALRLRPARPAADEDLARDLAELRQVVGDLAKAPPDTIRLRARQAELEQEVRRRTRRARGEEAAATHDVPVDAVRDALADRALVEYLVLDGRLRAVVVARDATTLVQLGAVGEVEDDLVALRHGLRKLAYGTGSEASLTAAEALVARRAARLDAALIGPLPLRNEELVVVPTGALHAVPWAALPSANGRPVSVSPSAALWLRAARRPESDGGAEIFAAGPRLQHAATEVGALAGRYPGARRLTGRNATVQAVAGSLDGARLAHLAAHGQFRTDNPLFSALELADGPLTVYDLERLARPPEHVILSACESGLSAVHPGDELLGLSAALLSMGSKTLVASVIPVPDAQVRTLMLRLHRHLRAGLPPAAALARAQSDLSGAGRAAAVTAAAFLCYGAG